ncbi:MAG: BTAD domain-containing putative transcriptional regulator [Actinomycetota bacterium]
MGTGRRGVDWGALAEPVASVDGTAIDLKGRPRSVLLVLLLAANRDVSIDRLIDRLWGDEPPKTARNSIARFVADIRAALGGHADRIVTVPGGYRVVVEEAELDIDIVESMLRSELSDDDPRARAARLTEVLDRIGLDPNPALSDLVDIAPQERAHAELKLELVEAVADARQQLGDHGDVIGVLEQAVALHPYHEALWASLMTSLDAAGRPAEALRAAHRLRGLLAEIGVSPTERILQVEDNVLRRVQGEEAPPTPAAARPPADDAAPRIRDPGTTLVGRVDELKDLHLRLRAHRHVSIVGLGGAGKTRLALGEIRAQEALDVPVYQVGLGEVSDPALVLPTVAAALELPVDAADSAASLAAAVAPDPFLLVLDNCEHLRRECADLVTALLAGPTHVGVLTTSRVPLGIEGEHIYRILPLQVEQRRGQVDLPAAIELFRDRAGARLPADFADGPALASVEQICAALSGHPLAIEVAAAQLAHVDLAQLSDRVVRPLSAEEDRSDPAVDALTTVLEWTWKSLTPSQQTLLARLSVFASGWERDAVGPVCGDSPTVDDDLDQLVRSGVVATRATAMGDRFEIVAAVHDFASARLADRLETSASRDRLATHVIDLANRRSNAAQHALAVASAELLPEHGNLSATMSHLKSQDRLEEVALLGIQAAGLWTNHRFPGELIRWLGPLVEDEAISDKARSGCAAHMCIAHHTLGNLELIEPFGTRAIELAAGEPYEWIPGGAGYMSVWSMLSETPLSTEEYTTISFDAAHRSDQDLTLGLAALYRGQLEFVSRRYDHALEWYTKGRALASGPGRQLLLCETWMALSTYLLGDRVEAAEMARRWVSRPRTDHWHYIVEIVRSIIIGGAGDPHAATAALAEDVRTRPGGLVWGQADTVQVAFALLADFRGETDLAADLFATANNRDLNMVAFTVEHEMNKRGLSGDEAWLELAAEQWTRIVPEDARKDRATTTADLVEWWSGDVTPGSGLLL